MAAAAKGGGLGVYVTTYVSRRDEGAEEELASARYCTEAADPQRNIVGHDAKAVLGWTKNYQADGSAACEGDTKLYAFAEDRVIPRMTGDDRVSVVWRRYRPKVASGVAQPGKPWEHDDVAAGVKVRVEVRQVVDDGKDQVTAKTVSLLAVQRLQVEHAIALKLNEERKNLRDGMIEFDLAHAPYAARLDQVAEELKDLPGRQEVDAALAAMRSEYAALREAAVAELRRGINAIPVDAQTRVRLDAMRAALPQSMAAIEAKAEPIRAKARALVELQAKLREAAKTCEEVWAKAEASKRNELPGLDVGGLGVESIAKHVEEALAESRLDTAYAAMPQLEKKLLAVEAELDELIEALNVRLAAERQKKASFAARVAAVNGIVDGTALPRFQSFVASGRMFSGFAYPHFAGELEKAWKSVAGKLQPLSADNYHDSAHEASLAKAEAVAAPVFDVVVAAEAHMVRRNAAMGGIYREVEAQGLKFQAPSAWFETKSVAKDGLVDAVAHLRNNAERPMAIEVHAGGKVAATVVLAAKGVHAAVELRGVANPLSVKVVAIGEPLRDVESGTSFSATRVAVEAFIDAACNDVLRLTKPGVTRHVLPAFFIVSPQQPAGNVKLSVPSDAPGVAFDRLPVPGLGQGSKS